MRSPFFRQGELGRPAYAVASIGAFLLQHMLAWTLRAASGDAAGPLPWWFWVNPLRAAWSILDPPPGWVILTAMAGLVLVDWGLVALALRRVRQAHLNPLLAALVMVPLLQVAVIAWLSLAPAARDSDPEPRADSSDETKPSRIDGNIGQITTGLLVGGGLCVAAVAFSTLVLHLYGYGLFVASPFVIGVTTGFIVNRRSRLSGGQTLAAVWGALGLGAAALIGFALEGLICLVLASPLIAVMGLLGAVLGREMAGIGRPGPRTAMMSLAILPILLSAETGLPPKAVFDSVESIEVAAPPSAVWDAVVHMGPIPDAPAPPFRWGLAYPIRGEINGAGVGAIRRGVFSTGVAYERVTEWEPGRKLSFVVLSDPPTMRELSPYQHVNAPHVVGYFKTRDARFTLTPLADGRTRLSLATRHELDLEPALYWLPIAEWATHVNKRRVLEHFRRQAEAGLGR